MKLYVRAVDYLTVYTSSKLNLTNMAILGKIVIIRVENGSSTLWLTPDASLGDNKSNLSV